MANQQRIFVDSLDGFEFEELCAEIYRRLGYEVVNVTDVGDEGRDLILTTSEGQKLVVECKHWPDKPVGRPVVQKLHSAVITLPAKGGILVTTGYFPKSARDYAARLKEPIELIDLLRLKDLAAKAGLTLVSTSDPNPVLRFATLGSDAFNRLFDSRIFTAFVSAPKPPGSLLTVLDHSVELRPTYLVRYSLKQDFRTSVGRIHHLDIRNATLLIDAESGQARDTAVAEFMERAAIIPLVDAPALSASPPYRSFKLTAAEVKETASDQIIRIHRTSVSYWGRNNQGYTLDCLPSKKNIFLYDIKQVFLPEHRVRIQAVDRGYDLEFIENGPGLHLLTPPDLFKCHICKRQLGRGSLCNSCGSVTCLPGPFWWDFYPVWLRSIFSKLFLSHVRPHSLRCTLCNKTICLRCTSWLSRWLFFKSPVCQDTHAT